VDIVIETIEDKILAELRNLSTDDQKRVLAFAASIRDKSSEQSASQTVDQGSFGMLKDKGLDISFEELQMLRKEMWASFPREID
jgi:hypothetical protein